jgi:hypothetical protein
MAAVAAALLVALTACSGPGEDVRVALCKDMAALATAGEDGTWESTVQEQGRYQDLVVTVRSDGRTATCRYGFDDTAADYSMPGDPLAVYDTYPSALTVNGDPVSGQRLARLVEQAMVQQGKELADKARERIEQAGEALKEGLSGGG